MAAKRRHAVDAAPSNPAPGQAAGGVEALLPARVLVSFLYHYPIRTYCEEELRSAARPPGASTKT